MTELDDLVLWVEKLDALLDSYQPGEIVPDKMLGEIFVERAAQRPMLEQVVQLATEGLQRYPYNAELLRRRAYARSLIVTPEGEYPELTLAEGDLRTLLALEPNHLYAGLELLEMMFVFSGMEDGEVAEVAGELGRRAEQVLIGYRALQIKALGYAGESERAEQVYSQWMKVFPDSESLRAAKADVDDLRSRGTIEKA